MAHPQDLYSQGPTKGYYLEPTKSILFVVLRNVAQAEEFFWGMEIKVVTGHHYLGGFIGDREAEKRWLS